jgi:tetratricopeptide (TPR) repeat protein
MGVMKEDIATFISAGDLAERPMPLLIMSIFRSGKSGMLHIDSSERQTWLYFLEGKPAGVQIANAEIYLGMIMRELQIISDMDFNDSLMKMAESNQLQGQVLLDMGKINQKQLDRALEVQMLRKTSKLFGILAGSFEFDPDGRLAERQVAFPVHPCAVIFNGIRNCYEETLLDEKLAFLTDKAVVALDLSEHRSLFSSDLDESNLDLLAQPINVDDFLAQAKAGPLAAKMLLLSLHWCGFLEDTDKLLAPAPKAVASDSPSPKKSTGVPAALLERIDEKYQQASSEDFLALLELTLSFSQEDLKKAFAASSSIYHPDRVARYHDADLEKKVSSIAAKVAEAHHVLSDPQRRDKYLNQVADTGDRPLTINPAAAQVAYQKAQVYVQKKRIKDAYDSMHLASRLDPQKTLYRIHSVWLDFLLDEDKSDNKKQSTKKALKTLFDSAPGNFWVNRYLALISQRLADQQEYEKHLQKAHRIRPNDIETARELRLYNSRKAKGDKKKFSLFGKKS